MTAVRSVKAYTEKICKKIKRKYIYKLKADKEYKRLKSLVPSVKHERKVNKIELIEEAVKYIDELHFKLAERLGLPVASFTTQDGQVDAEKFLKHLQQKIPDSLPPFLSEKSRTKNICS